MEPTLTGFIAWVRTAMGITTAQLPDNSIWFTYAFNVAESIVSDTIQQVDPLIYMLAVYNLGGDNLINYAQDIPPSTFFSDLRAKYLSYSFVAGVIQASADQSTSQSLLVPDAFKNLTLSNLQNLKTPWGRQYMAWAQDMGTLWGLT
jgi:hypothetical protein